MADQDEIFSASDSSSEEEEPEEAAAPPEGPQLSSDSSTVEIIGIVENWRIPRIHIPDDDEEVDSREAKRQRRESLEPFAKRLQKILPNTKVLKHENEFEKFYTKTRDQYYNDAFSCKAVENPDDPLPPAIAQENPAADETRAQEKAPKAGSALDRPESSAAPGPVSMFTRVREKMPKDGGIEFGMSEHLEYFRLYRELLIIGRILPPHPHLVRLKDILVARRKLFIVSERCSWANLDTYFLFAKNKTAHRIFKQLVEVVQLMHRHGVVNNYIHPRSIFFEDEEQFKNIKIMNFSRACFDPALVFEINNGFNPDEWLEPEEMKFATNATHPGNDVKALGRILIAMFTGFWENNATRFTLRSHRFDKEAHDLLMQMGPYPLTRTEVAMTIDDILKHPWMVMEPKKR